jgi:hypothetical protein
MQDDDALEASIEAEEAKWVASALSLYYFAATHASGITVDNGGHLVIANEELKQSLLQQINASTVLEQTMMNDRVKAVKNQHTLQDAVGMKHTD